MPAIHGDASCIYDLARQDALVYYFRSLVLLKRFGQRPKS
jgi:hypothetical protein